MAGDITIKLKQPITGHKSEITELTIRAPGLTLYAQHGEPFEWVPGATKKSQPVYIEHDDAIAAYVQACVEPPEGNPLLIEQIGLEDGMAIKDAIIDFFVEAKRARMSRRS